MGGGIIMRIKTEGRFIGTDKKMFDGVEKTYIIIQQEGDTAQEKFGLSRDFQEGMYTVSTVYCASIRGILDIYIYRLFAA